MTPEHSYANSTSEGARAAQHHWRERWLKLVDKLVVIGDAAELRALLDSISAAKRPTTVAFVNAHAMNLAATNPAFFEHLMDADVLLRDGIGMSVLLRLLGRRVGLNMNGTDFIPLLLERHKSSRMAMFGTQMEYLQRAARYLEHSGHIPGPTLLDGFQPETAYVVVVAKAQPQLVLLGMGMPKQEAVAVMLRQTASSPKLIICGGAIIDFLGGRVGRAPHFVRRMRLEWLYRLILEPRRLFHRYVIGNPVFLVRALHTSLLKNSRRRA